MVDITAQQEEILADYVKARFATNTVAADRFYNMAVTKITDGDTTILRHAEKWDKDGRKPLLGERGEATPYDAKQVFDQVASAHLTERVRRQRVKRDGPGGSGRGGGAD